MKIQIGNLHLTARDDAKVGSLKKTTIIIDTSEDRGNNVFEVDSEELKAAIEALEKTCWRV
jgi:hypothetical protein